MTTKTKPPTTRATAQIKQ